MCKKILILCLLILIGCNQKPSTMKAAFWNVENLFDLVDNPEKNDGEFALGGRKNCTQDILDIKLTNLSEVLSEINADVIGLCEVENRQVCEWLNEVYTGRDYSIVHYESPDNRGIDNMLFYDPNVFTVLDSYPISVIFRDGKPTRDILYVKGEFSREIIHIYINHWPSNYGGREQAIPRRARTAAVLREHIDTILSKDRDAEILLMGDLNENPTETAVQDILFSTINPESAEKGELINLMGPFIGKPKVGTYVWRNEDSFLDQVIISQGLIDSKGLSIISGSTSIHDKPKYRQQEGKYAHYPFRFWAGDKLLGGYSDHLAVSVEITTN